MPFRSKNIFMEELKVQMFQDKKQDSVKLPDSEEFTYLMLPASDSSHD
jgi:hypothetical protein